MPPTPGLLWAASSITRPDILTPSSFESWYNTEHIPDIFKTSAIRTAIRYRNIDPSASRQYLAIYPVPDVNWLGTKEFLDIPVTNKEIFKTENGKCFDCADFDTRFYEWVHGFEGEGAKPGPANLIISAALTPALGTDADFDAWYKEEHYRTLAECKGYVRTRRYKLKTAVTAKDAPTYLALHEFDSETLPQADLEKSGGTEWAKKIMGSLAGQDIMVFRLEGAFGDVKAKF